MEEEEKLKKALLKKALGYDANEVVCEYVCDEDGQAKLAKKKVTRKHFAPDVSALKIYIEKYYTSEFDKISSMSDQELEEEMARLIKLIKEENGIGDS